MTALKEFIQTTRDSRELKRALAVKNTLAGRPWREVADELAVCRAFVGKWRKMYAQEGVDGLRLRYKGSTGYLDRRPQSRGHYVDSGARTVVSDGVTDPYPL